MNTLDSRLVSLSTVVFCHMCLSVASFYLTKFAGMQSSSIIIQQFRYHYVNKVSPYLAGYSHKCCQSNNNKAYFTHDLYIKKPINNQSSHFISLIIHLMTLYIVASHWPGLRGDRAMLTSFDIGYVARTAPFGTI